MPVDLDLCSFAFFSERLTMFYLNWVLFETETALTHMVKKLCVACAGVCAAMKVCVPGNVITNMPGGKKGAYKEPG